MKKELVILAMGIEIATRMERESIFTRFEEATTKEEQLSIVRETEQFVVDVANKVFKSDEVIGAEGVRKKNKLIVELIKHNYEYFELDNPIASGEATYDELLNRNGIETEDDEFFRK